jgi:hypothetical protein
LDRTQEVVGSSPTSSIAPLSEKRPPLRGLSRESKTAGKRPNVQPVVASAPAAFFFASSAASSFASYSSKVALVVLGVPPEMAVGRVDHLHGSPHPSGECVGIHPGREHPCRVRVAHRVRSMKGLAVVVHEPARVERRLPIALPPVVKVESGRPSQRRTRAHRDPISPAEAPSLSRRPGSAGTAQAVPPRAPRRRPTTRRAGSRLGRPSHSRSCRGTPDSA